MHLQTHTPSIRIGVSGVTVKAEGWTPKVQNQASGNQADDNSYVNHQDLLSHERHGCKTHLEFLKMYLKIYFNILK